MRWVSTKESFPPDNWYGLILTDARWDRPVFAHTADEHYRREFPFSDRFIGRWRESLLTGEHMRSRAKVTFWLDTENEALYPPIPEDSDA